MALFRLRSQQTGEVRDFTILDILNALGDPVNDEIRFPDGNREDVFNLSSFQELNAGLPTGGPIQVGTGATRLVNEALPFVKGQQAINLGAIPSSICMVFLNGLKLRQGIDYNKSGRTLIFLSPLSASVNHTDMLEALYDTQA